MTIMMIFLLLNWINMAIMVYTRGKQMRLCRYSGASCSCILILLSVSNISIVALQTGIGNNTIDGCATFFRRDRFSHVKKYEVSWDLFCLFGSCLKFVCNLT